jgi:neutral ceramidase
MSTLAIATGSVDVTPRFPPFESGWMGGYGWVRRGNQGAVARNLNAQCAVIYDNGTPKVLVRVDTVTIPREVHQDIRQRVLDAKLVNSSADFFISISHTHSGPFLGHTSPDPFVMMDLAPDDIAAIDAATTRFADLIVQLVADTRALEPTPVTLGYAVGSATFAENRAGLPTVLTDVSVLLATAVDSGDPVAVLFGYACHPVSRGNDITFDSDYVGAATEAITAARGIPALFFQGTAGDHDPAGNRGADLPGQLGQQLADVVIEVLDKGEFTPVDGPIETRMVEVRLPFSVDLTDPAARAQLVAKYQQRVADNPGDNVINRHAQVMLRDLGDNTLAPGIAMPILCWRLDGLTIFALANEVVSEYDGEIKKFAPEPAWVMGYTNEISCYIPVDPMSWAGGDVHGGYEAGWTDDAMITGADTSMMAFTWPAPLKSSPKDCDPPASGSTQELVLDACRNLLKP